MFDVYYFGKSPNLFPHEKPADSIVNAGKQSRTNFFWYLDGQNDYSKFNFHFKPLPWEESYIHVWNNQWQTDGGVYLINKNHVDSSYLYHADCQVHRLPNPTWWSVPDHIDITSVDLRWAPDPMDPPYEYHFPSQHQSSSGVTYTCPNAIGIKLIDAFVVTAVPTTDNWCIPENIDITSIDFSWHPNPLDTPTTYHFPVQWNWDNIGGPEYRVPGAIGDKFISNFVAITKSNMENWIIPDNIDRKSFDFTWVPHPADPPFVYKFPTQWNNEGGPEYHVPDAVEVKYINVQVASTICDTSCWTIPEEINVDTIDFTWVPHPKSPPYIYHFGTEHQSSVGLTYTVPGATELKFAGDIPTKDTNKKALEVLDIFFIDFNNSTAKNKFDKLTERYAATKIRYANSIIDTIKRCTTRSKTSKFWVISSECDYSEFDFSWHAEPWQSYMTHVFASQHQKWSNTFLINKWEFDRNITWAKSLEEFPNLNFVSGQAITMPSDLYDIYLVDHGNEHSPSLAYIDNLKTTRYVDNYLDTFKRIMSTATTEYVWIISSLCEYHKFDFSWYPEPWQKEMIHVFPSGNQARGDTFFIHVESFKQQMVELDILDWFNVINYCSEQTVSRMPVPNCIYKDDTLIETIKNHNFKHPYTYFAPHNYPITLDFCVWGAKDKKIHSFSDGNAYVLVPREAKTAIKTQGYDYPYISKLSSYFDESKLDIIYISNGESHEEEMSDHLVKVAGEIQWVRNVPSRDAAIRRAAEQSSTPWFFAVPAKLAVDSKFDWYWQPDYLQESKHYIFHAKNPVNGLIYGHMAMVAYNRKLVLETTEYGLDFTLSKAHTVVPLLSGVAHYNVDKLMTWRTAFREVLKLKYDVDQTGSIDSTHRLKVWLTVAIGENAEWSLRGSEDAITYYNTVNGDYDRLMNSFNWVWLENYFNTLYMSST